MCNTLILYCHLPVLKLKPVAKADRLLTLISLLKGRRTVITARQLADTLETSIRTIYRDIQLLIDTGVPIEGEAGIGYRLKPGSAIAPIMFTLEELLAVQLGLKMVKGWSDKELAIAAEKARIKIESVIPEHLKENTVQKTLLVPEYYIQSTSSGYAIKIRHAIENNQSLKIDYVRADGQFSNREVYPLGLVFWGQKWTLIAWCLLRKNYREFRLDRIQHLTENTLKNIRPNNINLETYLSSLG